MVCFKAMTNPFFVTVIQQNSSMISPMTVGIPDTPIPASFDSHEEWGERGLLKVLFRKEMTAILWNACEQAKDTPFKFEYMLSDVNSWREWPGPPFPEHHGDSRPPSPEYDRDSLADALEVWVQAQIYEEALNSVANCFLETWRNDDYVRWDDTHELVPAENNEEELSREEINRREIWMDNQRVVFTIKVYGPGNVINRYEYRHDAGDDRYCWSFHRYRNDHPAPRNEVVD